MLQDIVDILKPLFVEECSNYLSKSGSKVNVNRISLASGVHRTDVKAIFRDEQPPARTPSLLWRVLGHWSGHKKFTTSSGKPRVLQFDHGSPNFCELCLSVSRFLNPKTVLEELRRKGAIQETGSGIRILFSEEKVGDSLERRWDLLESVVNNVLVSVEQNSQPNFTPRNLLAVTEFDNIDPEQAKRVRAWVLDEGKRFHARLRKHLGNLDRDLMQDNETDDKSALKVSVATIAMGEIENQAQESDND